MNAAANIERRDSGPALQDRTADSYFVLPGAVDAACIRHAERFDAGDLVEMVEGMEVVDLQRMLAAIKAGDAQAAGQMLVEKFVETIGDLATWSLAA